MAAARFVELEPGARTYVARMRVEPEYASPMTEFVSRAARKAMAWSAMRESEGAIAERLTPQLEALRHQGLVTSYEYAAGTGALIINVAERRAGAAWEALRGVAELGRIVRNREVRLDTAMGEAVAGDAGAAAAVAGPGASVEPNVARVNAPRAWASGATGAGVVVGIVDTGANTTHEALRGHYRGTRADGTQVHDYNFFDAVAGRTTPYDDSNHGSHVAGTIVGGTATRHIGVAPGATFIAAKVFGGTGGGSTATILRGLSWMLAPTDSSGRNADPRRAPDIVNNSWSSRDGASLAYLGAFRAFEAAGIVPIASAGNNGPGERTVGSPGSYPQAITVGATDRADTIARSSSRGPSPLGGPAGRPAPKPDVVAPGVDVLSAGRSGNEYVRLSGTSMAAPAVAGVAALILGRHPRIGTEGVRQALTRGAADLGFPGVDTSYGAGRVDAVASLRAAALIALMPPSTRR